MTVNILDHSRSHTPAERTSGRFHSAPSRKSIPTLQPVMVSLLLFAFFFFFYSRLNIRQSKTVDVTILTNVYCLPDAIATVSRQGVARFWMRPSSRPPPAWAWSRVHKTRYVLAPIHPKEVPTNRHQQPVKDVWSICEKEWDWKGQPMMTLMVILWFIKLYQKYKLLGYVVNNSHVNVNLPN